MAAPIEKSRIYTGVTLDFETGGLDPKKHGVTQVGMQIVRLDTFEVLNSYNSLIIPYEKVQFNNKKILRKKKADKEEAELMEYDWEMTDRVSGITEKMCYEHGKPLKTVVEEMIEFISSAKLTNHKDTYPILIGQNICFDLGMLHQIFAFTNNKLNKLFAGSNGFYGWNIRTMDTQDLVKLYELGGKQIGKFNLTDICERLEVDAFDSHDALGDVEATTDVVRVLGNKMRVGGGLLTNNGKSEKEKTRKHFNM